MAATITPAYSLQVGEQYDPIILMAIFNGGLSISGIVGSEIATGTVDTSNIADSAITTDKIAAANITGVKIAADAIDGTHIASNTISADHIGSDAITATKISSGAVTTDKIYAGAVTSDKISVNSLSAISANLGEMTSGIVTASTVRTSADPSVNRVIMDESGLRGYDTELGLVFNIYTDGSPPLFASGKIQSATIIDTTIISNDFKTSSELPWIELSDSGVAYRFAGAGDVYGTGVYGTATYGAGVAAYFGNSSKPVLSIEEGLSYSDVRLYNRSSHSSGASAVGDLEVVSSKLYMCTSAGTPGSFSEFTFDGGSWYGTIDGNWTAAGQTCSDLGTVTTADINGGTFDGIVGGTTPAAGSFTNIIGTGTLTLNDASNATVEEIDNDGTGYGLYLHQDGVLATTKQGLRVYSNAAQVNADSALVKIYQDNASATEPALEILNDGSGAEIEVNTNEFILTGGRVGLGVVPSSYADLTLGSTGVLCLSEAPDTPTANEGYGKVYTKDDNKLYFQDGAGNEHEVSLVA